MTKRDIGKAIVKLIKKKINPVNSARKLPNSGKNDTK